MSDKCPLCGAESNKDEYPYSENYKCGAFWRGGKLLRSRPECYENELTQLRTRIKQLEAVAEAALEYRFAGIHLVSADELDSKLKNAGYLKD